MAKELLYVVLPCYNEGHSIRNLIQEWEKLEKSLGDKELALKLVIVNDGSDRKTEDIIDFLEKSYENVKVLHHEQNKGLGAAIQSGINYCLSQDTGMGICIMDGDNTHPPEYIFSMVDKMRNKSKDCVIASRYRRSSKIEGLSAYRKLLSLGARYLYTLRFRVPGEGGYLRDYTCGYRLYKYSMLKQLAGKYEESLITETGFTCMVELLVKISKAHYKISEVPFNLKYNLKEGQSSMKIFKTINRSLYLMMKI